MIKTLEYTKVLLAFLLVVALALGTILWPQTETASAATYAPNHSSVLFDKNQTDSSIQLWLEGEDGYYDSDINTWGYDADNGVVKINKEYWAADQYVLSLTPIKAGSTEIILVDPNGNAYTVPITVKADYFKPALKEFSEVSPADGSYAGKKFYYGETKYEVSTLPYATVKLTVKGKTKKATANSAGQCTIKIPKVYKIKTKVKVSFSRGGKTYSKTYKIKDGSSLKYNTKKKVKRNRYKLMFSAFNLHKGDVVKVKIKGKTFKKKISKNHPNYVYVTIPRYAKKIKYTVRLYNKYKQRMYKKTRKL